MGISDFIIIGGIIIIPILVFFIIPRLITAHDNYEIKQRQELYKLADDFDELSKCSAETSVSTAQFADVCRKMAENFCADFTNKTKEKIEEMKATAGRGEEKEYVLSTDSDKLTYSPHEIEPVWVSDRPRRLKCSYCGCISEKDYGTCDHCGAPLAEEEEKEYMLTYHGKQL